MTILITVAIYFGILLLISRLAGKGGNDAFFRGNRQSPWQLVAFGMIGASLSGVTFISVPGMVGAIDMTYMQMCIGFFFGYVVVAFVLLPLYYRHGFTSIYGYLDKRFGTESHITGASFFILSKLTGAAARLYLVCLILQQYVFDSLGIPYFITVIATLLMIWLYTRHSGIRALVWTDSLQTLCLILALVLILYKTISMLGMDAGEALRAVWNDSHSRIFEFGDWTSQQHFVKQFLSGVFIVIVMTGLDQDMMQKNLTCKNLHDAQKDLCSYGVLFMPVNFLFLSLGILMMMLYAKTGTPLPAGGDSILPDLIASGQMGHTVLILFTIGIIASAFSSADSAMTALTTSFCVDILDVENKRGKFYPQRERVRKVVHICMMAIFVGFILAFKAIGSTSVIDAIYVIASYTYGPLLGLFAFGMTTRLVPHGRYVPFIAILSPIVCYLIDLLIRNTTGYKFGYEMLMFNGLLTYMGLWLASGKKNVAEYKHKV
ncbi:MAG: sodium:solute symporter [Bacteroides sp.]|nr:sodium:solute symporter [Roseburia sp.]MCM1346255.1 sodium:solute symporter [Bacteroides sp.]MCM1420828.1 sodium:solute symporter [Bacteroides sp.]